MDTSKMAEEMADQIVLRLSYQGLYLGLTMMAVGAIGMYMSRYT